MKPSMWLHLRTTRTRVPLSQLHARLLSARGIDLATFKRYRPQSSVVRTAKTFGCVITSHNNSHAIRDAVFLALDQTKPYHLTGHQILNNVQDME